MINARACLFLNLIMLGLLLVAAPALSRTWTVEKDGSGDFAVIQDAVDAASSGDVIAIGPGRYDEYQTVAAGSYWWDIHVDIPGNIDLTFIGSGAESTIIGPDDPDSHTNQTNGIRGLDNDIVISGIGIENCNFFAIGLQVGSLVADNCRFSFFGQPTYDTRGPYGGFTRGAAFSDCSFEGMAKGIATINSPGGVRVENCVFTECIEGIYAWTTGSNDVQVVDCEFSGGFSGVGFLSGSGGLIENCSFVNCRIGMDSCGETVITNCEVTRDDGGMALNLSNQAPITLVDNSFETNGLVAYLASNGGTILNNHFIRTGSDYWLYCPDNSAPPQDIDLSGNWWGTTDVAEIAAGIWDCHQHENANHCVIFEPIADGPVSVETHSWSSVKSLFR